MKIESKNKRVHSEAGPQRSGSTAKRVHNRKGFTLAEMLIVVLIIGVLMGIGSRTYFVEKDRFEFNNAFNQTMQIIKSTRSMASNSEAYFIPSENLNVIPRAGYGVMVNLDPDTDEHHVTTFANLGADPDFINDDDPLAFNSPGFFSDEIIETYDLPKNVVFHSLCYDFASDSPDNGLQEQWNYDPSIDRATREKAIIMFTPPLGSAYIGEIQTNDEPGSALNAVRLNFVNPSVEDTSPKKCLTIDINSVQSFPKLSFSNLDDCAPSLSPVPRTPQNRCI